MEWCFLFFLSLALSLSLLLARARCLSSARVRCFSIRMKKDDIKRRKREKWWTNNDNWTGMDVYRSHVYSFLKAASLFIEHHYCSSMPFLAWPTWRERKSKRIFFAENNNQIIYLLFLSQSASWLTSNTRIVIPHQCCQCANFSHEEKPPIDF